MSAPVVEIDRKVESSKAAAIVAAARRELDVNGIVGLRVQEVSRVANCSVSLIYRHFTSREGLIAEVLTEDLTTNIAKWGVIADALEAGTGPIDVDAIIRQLPMSDSPEVSRVRWTRVQALASSIDNTVLRARLTELASSLQRQTTRIVEQLIMRNGVKRPFDVQAFTLLSNTFALMAIQNELLPDAERINEERMHAFMCDMVGRYFGPDTDH